MQNNFNYVVRSRDRVQLEINSVLKNTYMLLSVTIFFSAIMAFFSMKLGFGRINFIYMMVMFFGLLYLINSFKDSVLGLFFVFIFTGVLGFSTGPVLNSVLKMSNGQELLLFSLFSTGSIFLVLSFYVLLTKRNFDFLSGFIGVGVIVVFLCIIFSLFYYTPLLNLIISGFIVILSSSLILYETSRIVNGGEDNYILATISLYMQIYNLFLSLLNIFGIFNED